MCHVLKINFLMIMEKAVYTLGLITLQDQKIKSNNYHFLCVGRLINILVLCLLQHLSWIGNIQYHENRTFLFLFEYICMMYAFTFAVFYKSTSLRT